VGGAALPDGASSRRTWERDHAREQRMIPKSCRLFGQDHAREQGPGARSLQPGAISSAGVLTSLRRGSCREV
jgi:hypothetical protein